MQTITTIGLDIAKSVFQVHGVKAGSQAVIRRQLKRRRVLAFFQKLSPCLVGIEACASAAKFRQKLPMAMQKASSHAARSPVPGCAPALCGSRMISAIIKAARIAEA
jgi:transposase